MSPRPAFRRLFRFPWRSREQIRDEVEEEIRFHLDMRVEELTRQGHSAAEARRLARREFGDLDEARGSLRRADESREVVRRWLEWCDTVAKDLRYTARTLAGSPGFSAVAVLTLALGIGANTAIFSLVDAVVLRPPAHVAEPGRLVRVYTSDFSGPLYGGSSYPDYRDLGAQATGLSGLAAWSQRQLSLDTGEETARVTAEMVSGSYFPLLGVEPAVGRLFLPSEGETPGRDAVVVLSHGLWQSQFGADPGAVGRTVQVNGQPLTVVGVAPPGFAGATGRDPSELWVPLGMEPVLLPALGGASRLTERGARWLSLIGRLDRGVSPERAQARLSSLAGVLFERHPEAWSDLRRQPRSITAVPEARARVSPSERASILGFLGMLAGMVWLVLLIACANLANLLLARASRRRRELAIRLALGASRGRIVRQLMTESLVLAALGGGAGIVLALGGTRAVRGLELAAPVPLDLRLDGRVLAFALSASLLTAMLFGLVPALRAARPDLVPSLRDQTPGSSGVGGSLRRFLVVGQVAICVVLLVCASLFVRSLRNAASVELGFDPRGVLLVPAPLGVHGYGEAEGRSLQGELVRRLGSLPGVESVALAEIVPLSGSYQRGSIEVPGYQPTPGEDMELDFNLVTAGYFQTMRIPVGQGRGFTDLDREGAPPVAIVSEAFARRFWPGEAPLGKRFRFGPSDQPLAEVVGVVPDMKLRSLAEPPRPAFYLPLPQAYAPDVVVHVRTGGDPGSLLPRVRSEIRALDPGLPTRDAATFQEAMSGQLLPLQAASSLLSGFGLLGLAVAMVGLYGVLAYLVSSRTREMAIRIALGSSGRGVLRLVLGEGIRLALVGLAVGTLAAVVAARLVSGLLFQVDATDPVGFASTLALMLAVALLAAYLPARRATRVDPLAALRAE